MLDYASFPDQRQSLIRELLRKEGRVLCVKLARELDVSEHTIRRDLKELAHEGVCKRVYGGAVSIAPSSGSFLQRAAEDNDRKKALGTACAGLLRAETCVFIDSGSTNLATARALPPELALTIVTNSPAIALELLKSPAKEVIMLGGRVRSSIGGALGITPLQQMENIVFDQCLLGGCALDIDEGLTAFDHEDAEFKRAVVRRSNEVIVALTSEKIPTVARYQVAACQDITVLVVEHDQSPEKLAPFKEKIMEIHFTPDR